MNPATLRDRAAVPFLNRTAQLHRVATRLAEGLEIAPLVAEPWHYTLDHVLRRDVGVYTLAATGQKVSLRHPHAGTDPLTLREIFAESAYELPAAASQRVRAHGGTIVDLGGNVGFAALWFDRTFPGQPIITVEPDPANVILLRRCAELNERGWVVIEAAASNQDGKTRFRAGLGWESHIDVGGDTIVATVDVFRYLKDAALLKIDIEGGEWSIITDDRLRHAAVPVIVLEHHTHMCPTPDPRAAAITALEDAGYNVTLREECEPGKGILLGIRP